MVRIHRDKCHNGRTAPPRPWNIEALPALSTQTLDFWSAAVFPRRKGHGAFAVGPSDSLFWPSDSGGFGFPKPEHPQCGPREDKSQKLLAQSPEAQLYPESLQLLRTSLTSSISNLQPTPASVWSKTKTCAAYSMKHEGT